MVDTQLNWLYGTAQTMTSIVEIGSWKGRSTHALLSGCPGQVFAVDHFMGNPYQREEGRAHHEAVTGDIFSQFWTNVGHFKNLVVMRMPSIVAAQYFAPASVDMVFIDGDHTTDAVVSDLASWRPKCRRLLCGHDALTGSVIDGLKEMGYRYQEVNGFAIWRINFAT
jgi:predicted O-methyltransferase YrrM